MSENGTSDEAARDNTRDGAREEAAGEARGDANPDSRAPRDASPVPPVEAPPAEAPPAEPVPSRPVASTRVAPEPGVFAGREAMRVLAAMPQPVVVFSPEGAFRFCNPAFAAVLVRLGAGARPSGETFGVDAAADDARDVPVRLVGAATAEGVNEATYLFSRTGILDMGWVCVGVKAPAAAERPAVTERAVVGNTGTGGRSASAGAPGGGVATGEETDAAASKEPAAPVEPAASAPAANASVANGAATETIDDLTGLATRATMLRTLDTALRTHARGGRLAFHMIDLDRFKPINDTLGHATGDKLLAKVAARLHSCVRKGDLLARMGGDEFALLQLSPGGTDEVEALANRLTDVAARPYIVDGQMMEIGASVGIALAPDDADATDTLVQRADVALYRVKEEGRGGYRFFEPGMDAALRARRELDREMRRALAYRQFALHYQPQLDFETGRLMGFEALLRWEHPERGTIAPVDFVPLAEETGFIVPLGEWVIRQACADAARWPDEIGVAVNLSTRQLMDPTLVGSVSAALAANGLTADRFEVEVTESVLMADETTCLATLFALRDLGITVSIDDFGTGYSSISYLRKFPFDKLKLDQSFVRGPDADKEAALVRAILDLGRHFSMRTVAEGVETDAQARAMRAFGCTAMQGHLLSKPVRAEEVADCIAADRSAFAPATDAPVESMAGVEAVADAPPLAPAESDLRDAMEADLVRLVYVSRAAADLLEDDHRASVRSILETSRRNNAAADVSGALLFGGGHFAQILEGPAEAVEATFERIQLDDRHTRVNLIDFAPAGERRFASWSMAAVDGVEIEGVDDLSVWREGSGRAEGDAFIDMLVNILEDEARHQMA